ncbi:hypothetical protein OG984_14030 [Nocardioides sp. NBC_00368]|uniref:hypothetical protein n=1 Tax=Nocardioides sp. NBC_00368 TaxID=2976000 RepID=UPI002E20998A
MISARLTLAVATLLAASALSGCGAETSTAAEADHAGHGSTQTAEPSGTTTPSPPDAPTASSRPTGDVIRIEIVAGKLSPPAHVERVALGESVTLAVTSDVADEVHVHGYDAHVDLVAGQEGALTFTADIPGRFEVELEGAGALLVELEVK